MSTVLGFIIGVVAGVIIGYVLHDRYAPYVHMVKQASKNVKNPDIMGALIKDNEASREVPIGVN